MRRLSITFFAVCFGAAAFATAQGQVSDGMHRGRSMSNERSSHRIKGPNAAFKNQQRKLSDPLNANGK